MENITRDVGAHREWWGASFVRRPGSEGAIFVNGLEHWKMDTFMLRIHMCLTFRTNKWGSG